MNNQVRSLHSIEIQRRRVPGALQCCQVWCLLTALTSRTHNKKGRMRCALRTLSPNFSAKTQHLWSDSGRRFGQVFDRFVLMVLQLGFVLDYLTIQLVNQRVDRSI